MAERRMFAKTIIDSDAFIDMPLTAQVLYFHLAMRADDDGFINNPKKIKRMVGCSDDDLKLLCAKRFLIPFESGVVVIKHWKIHNYIQKDRYKPTVYEEEKAMLETKENGSYTLPIQPVDTVCIHDGYKMDTDGIPNGYQMDTQVRIGKESIGKDSKKAFSKPSVDEVREYCRERNNNIDAEAFVDFYESKGWKVGNNQMKDWKACIRTWEKRRTETTKPVTNNKFNNFTERDYTDADYRNMERALLGIK